MPFLRSSECFAVPQKKRHVVFLEWPGSGRARLGTTVCVDFHPNNFNVPFLRSSECFAVQQKKRPVAFLECREVEVGVAWSAPDDQGTRNPTFCVDHYQPHFLFETHFQLSFQKKTTMQQR
jgi:hypothetical protein